MKHYPGFEPKDKRDSGSTYTIAHMREVSLTVPRLESLLNEIRKHKLSPRCYGLFHDLAAKTPAVRLVVNLKVMLGLLYDHVVENVLIDGLTGDERKALIELDSSGVPTGVRETAHALLDIESRVALAKSFSGVFRNLRVKRKAKLT